MGICGVWEFEVRPEYGNAEYGESLKMQSLAKASSVLLIVWQIEAQRSTSRFVDPICWPSSSVSIGLVNKNKAK